jgi:hypothetical protein
VPQLPQRQVFNPIRKVLRCTSVSDQFQVPHTLPNGHLELMGIDNSGKRHTLLLPLGRFAEQVLVLTEQDATQSRRTIKQLGVGETSGTVLLCRQYVHSAQMQANRDRIGNVHVHVQLYAHGNLPKARSRFRTGDSPACAIRASTRWSCSSIAASNAC